MTDDEKKLIQAQHRLEEAQARNRVYCLFGIGVKIQGSMLNKPHADTAIIRTSAVR